MSLELNKILKDIHEISTSLSEQAKSEYQYIENKETAKILEAFYRERHDIGFGADIMWLSGFVEMLILDGHRERVVQAMGLNTLSRLFLRTEQSLTAIVNEASILKQQKAMPMAGEKTRNLEKKVKALDKQFRKYRRTLDDFTSMLEHTKKVLGENR